LKRKQATNCALSIEILIWDLIDLSNDTLSYQGMDIAHCVYGTAEVAAMMYERICLCADSSVSGWLGNGAEK
jgi:hypothetical protein